MVAPRGNIISVLDLWLRSALQQALWWLSIRIIGMVWKMMNTKRTFFSRWRSWSDINSWMKRCHKRLLWSCEPCCYAVCVKLHFSSRRSYSTIFWRQFNHYGNNEEERSGCDYFVRNMFDRCLSCPVLWLCVGSLVPLPLSSHPLWQYLRSSV